MWRGMTDANLKPMVTHVESSSQGHFSGTVSGGRERIRVQISIDIAANW